MSVSIYWRLMFRVNDARALDRCLARTLPLLGGGVEVGDCKPYWKIPELWECNLKSPVAAGPPSEQVLACLIAATSLATGWYILGSLSAQTVMGFNGVFSVEGHGRASGPAVGLEWASFELGTTRITEPNVAPDRGGMT